MCNMYEIVEQLCEKRGIKPGKMCADLGISRGIMGDLKAGRTKKLSAENLAKVSGYFGVPTDLLLGTETEPEKTKAPASEADTRSVEEILEQAREQLLNQEGLMFEGGVATDEAIESILAAMKIGLELAKTKTQAEKERAAKLKAEILAEAEAMED